MASSHNIVPNSIIINMSYKTNNYLESIMNTVQRHAAKIGKHSTDKFLQLTPAPR